MADAAATKELEDAGRDELAAQLDAELEAFIAEKAKNKKEEPMKEQSIEELAEELNNHPAFMKELDLSKPLSPAMEALQAMKYDTTVAEDKAESYKDDGNNNFKQKKYRWAVDSYTEGIKAQAADKELNAILYSNRAAANFYLGNYGSSFKDAVVALKFKPDHMKAIHRTAQCSMELKKYDNVMKWADEGLKIQPGETKLIEMRSKADKMKREQERDQRREESKKRRAKAHERKLLEAIQQRGVKLADVKPGKELEICGQNALESLEAPGVPCPKVRLDEKGALIWPVVFLYPEYQETDFIQDYHEDVAFIDHIVTMFGPGCEPPPWDVEKKYQAENLEVYYEDRKAGTLHHVKTTTSLKLLLKKKNYVVHGGTPGVILLVRGSPFAAQFLKRYK